MEWKKEILQNAEWTKEISHLDQKVKIAKKVAGLVENRQVIGFGSGSTSYLAAKEIAKRVKEEGLQIKAIPTSYEITILCHSLGIETSTLLKEKPDWGFDGADEVDRNSWLIKGRGAAAFQEKLIMKNAPKTYILVDESKLVDTLCTNFAIPVECYPESLYSVKEELWNLGATKIELRSANKKDGPVITENGNIILDTKFEKMEENLEKEIKQIVGVLESGLFIGYPVEILR